MIKSRNQVDRALFNFLFNSFENSLIGHKDMNTRSLDSGSSDLLH